mgnify:CR=1 FL=1
MAAETALSWKYCLRCFRCCSAACLRARSPALTGVIVAGDFFGRLFRGGLFLLLLHLFGLAPDHKLCADAGDALGTQRLADGVRGFAGRESGGFEHAALDQLVAVKQDDSLVQQRVGNTALADDERHVQRIGLRAKLGAAVPGHMDLERYEFCWIVDFPMYEIGEESGELEFCHNPFSMPNGGLEILEQAERGEVDPLDINAFQYDLVCNGVELSSGAVRNHDPEIMVKAFELVRLGEDDVKAKFPAMYNAFCYGAPPHAGIAPGVDRMVMLLAGEDSIREIIPFPMNKNAQDVMMGAPGTVEPHQLEELHIAVVGDTEPDTEA